MYVIKESMFLNPKARTEPVAQTSLTSRRLERAARRHRNPSVTLEIVAEESGGIPLSCFDLSAVGAYLHSDYLFCLGESLHLRIRIADRPLPIDIEGEVIRVETGENGLVPGMGIAFRKIGKQDAEALKRFLMRRFLTHG